MYSRITFSVVVCLVLSVTIIAAEVPAWDLAQAAFVQAKQEQPEQTTPAAPKTKAITKVKPKRIVKCKPVDAGYDPAVLYGGRSDCLLPFERPKGWAVDAEALFARTKGKVRNVRGAYAALYAYNDVDLNGDMGVPDHNVLGTFSAKYRFNPGWSIRYSITPFLAENTGTAGSGFTFGSVNTVGYGQPTRVKWERLYQRIGLVYDPIRTYSSRVSVFGDFVRVDDKIEFVQIGCCGSTMNSDLNMAMAGLEFERCLKTTRTCSTFSLECKAGVAFADEAVGGDISTGIKYSIPLNNGRWGFLKGGYRYLTYKKKYSDARLIDTVMEGGFVQMGFVF